MTCIDSKDVPQSLLPSGPSRKRDIDAIGTLQAYSLIKKRRTDLALDTYRLVHLATQNWLRIEKLLTYWTEKAVERIAQVFPDDKPQNRKAWRRYLTHACYTLDSQLVDNGERRVDLAWKVGNCLVSDGRYEEAEGLFQQVVDYRKQKLREKDFETLTSMNNLGSLLVMQGKYNVAKPI
jgi:tetratricopeptide (TPR) repeat protein